MQNISDTQPRSRKLTTVSALLWCVLLAVVGCEQADRSHSYRFGIGINRASINDAVAKLKKGNLYGLDLLGRAGARETIPLLEKQFAQSKDILDKAKIAQVLVELRDQKEIYWNYLVELAMPALDKRTPNPFVLDPNGKILQITPEFMAWVDAHSRFPDVGAGAYAVYILPGGIGLLALTESSRAVPFLRKALNSPDFFVVAVAARGLAELQDKGSIPFIVGAVNREPPELASTIAESLLYFDDPRAQDVFDKHVPKDRAKMLRKGKFDGRTPFH